MIGILRRLKAILVQDEKFLGAIGSVENLVAKLLSIGMIFVTFFALAQLSYAIIDKFLFTINRPNNDSFNTILFELFGLFLNVLIALEILENITAYLRKYVIQIELVLVTSLTAVARKIIILDLEKKSSSDLIALAVAVFSLSVGYAIVHQTNKSRS